MYMRGPDLLLGAGFCPWAFVGAFPWALAGRLPWALVGPSQYFFFVVLFPLPLRWHAATWCIRVWSAAWIFFITQRHCRGTCCSG